MSCLIDTGAECSLIKNKSSGSIPGQRVTEILHLRGIGGQSIVSNETIKTTGKIDEVTFELDLHIIDDLAYDVILGADTLHTPGLKIQITQNGISVKRECFVAQAQKEPLHVQSDTGLSDTLELHKILAKHSNSFGIKIPIHKVKTGSLKIRLKNPDRIVQRRPYRLSTLT